MNVLNMEGTMRKLILSSLLPLFAIVGQSFASETTSGFKPNRILQDNEKTEAMEKKYCIDIDCESECDPLCPQHPDFESFYQDSSIDYLKDTVSEEDPVLLVSLFPFTQKVYEQLCGGSNENYECLEEGKVKYRVHKNYYGYANFKVLPPQKIVSIFDPESLEEKIDQVKSFIDQAAEDQRNTVALVLSDLHGAAFMYPHLEKIVQDVSQYGHGKNVRTVVLIPGDLADRAGHSATPDDFEDHPACFNSSRLRDFLANLTKDADLVLFTPGNHDTQNEDVWTSFIERNRGLFENTEEHSFYFLSNLVDPDGKSPFASAEEGVFVPWVIVGNTLFFPYGTNYGLLGKSAISDETVSDSLITFFTDGDRRGYPDGLFNEEEKEDEDGKDNDSNSGNSNKKLNLIAERTMNNLVAGLLKLATLNSQGRLNVVFDAHDSIFRLAAFLELTSRYGLRLPKDLLQRLCFHTAVAHDHKGYTISHDIYMYSREGDIVAIPNYAVGSGIFGSSVGLLAFNIDYSQNPAA